MEHHDVSYQGKLTFISDYEPQLEAGRYRLGVTQKVRKEEAVGETVEFVVSAPRFSLDEGEVFSLFPPNGGMADYDGAVPSISFSRRTLPWERSPSKVDARDGAAWLVLILVDEDELVTGAEDPLDPGNAREVYADAREKTRWTLDATKEWLGLDDLEDWIGYDANLPLRVLEIGSELFQQLMPTYDDLKLLSHARRNTTEAGAVTSELGTVLGNRLPTPGKTNTVYLVSIEERYDAEGKLQRYGPASDGTQRLVILHRWRFHCRDSELYGYTVTPEILLDAARQDHRIPQPEPMPTWVGFEYDGQAGREALLGQVGEWLASGQSDQTDEGDLTVPPAVRIPPEVRKHLHGEGKDAEWAEVIVEMGRHREGTFTEILQKVRVGLLQDAAKHEHPLPEKAQSMVESGHTVLKHHLRAGGTTYSWLKGALAARELGDMGFSFPAATADDLLIFHEATGMFDASYAAAWALGRLKGMENKALSVSLFRWRHEQLHAQAGHRHGHLPVPPLPDSPLPEDVVEQVEAWKLLRGIPFEYLVPNPKLLPTESLRFFHLDHNWMRCFVDGFFGVAKVHGLTDFSREHALFPSFDRPVTGVLLRSNAVAGWPSMHVNAYPEAMAPNHIDPAARHLRVLRKERLQSEVLIFLFDGVPATLDLYLSPEGVHSGLERADEDGNAPRYTRRVRHPETGEEIEGASVVGIDATRGSQQYRTFTATQLKHQLDTQLEHDLHAGELGLQLIDGAPLVRYQLRSSRS